MGLYLILKTLQIPKLFFIFSSHTCSEMGNQEDESWFWSQRKTAGKNREEEEEWARTCAQWIHLPPMSCSNEGSKSHCMGLNWDCPATNPINPAASTNERDTSAGLSCHCFWASSGPTKHLGHWRLLSADICKQKQEKSCHSMHSTALISTHWAQKAAHILCTPGTWSGLAKTYSSLWMPALPSSLLINLSPHLAHTQISKEINIFYSQNQ